MVESTRCNLSKNGDDFISFVLSLRKRQIWGLKSSGIQYHWTLEHFWNPHHHFVLADGVSCFKNGEEYTHGGLSLQECLTLELTVSPKVGELQSVSVEVTDITKRVTLYYRSGLLFCQFVAGYLTTAWGCFIQCSCRYKIFKRQWYRIRCL